MEPKCLKSLSRQWNHKAKPTSTQFQSPGFQRLLKCLDLPSKSSCSSPEGIILFSTYDCPNTQTLHLLVLRLRITAHHKIFTLWIFTEKLGWPSGKRNSKPNPQFPTPSTEISIVLAPEDSMASFWLMKTFLCIGLCKWLWAMTVGNKFGKRKNKSWGVVVLKYPPPGLRRSCWLTKIQGGFFQSQEEFGEWIYTECRQKCPQTFLCPQWWGIWGESSHQHVAKLKTSWVAASILSQQR